MEFKLIVSKIKKNMVLGYHTDDKMGKETRYRTEKLKDSKEKLKNSKEVV